jgi:hypothetical protein
MMDHDLRVLATTSGHGYLDRSIAAAQSQLVSRRPVTEGSIGTASKYRSEVATAARQHAMADCVHAVVNSVERSGRNSPSDLLATQAKRTQLR